jgi:hypothetical protein
MSKFTLRLSLALLLFLSACLTAAHGGEALPSGTVKCPPDKPVFTIEVPDSWKAEYMVGTGVLGLDAKDDSASITISPTTDTSITEDTAKAALVKEALAIWAKAKNTEPAELPEPVAGHKAFTTKLTDDMGDHEYTIFTPDGKAWFLFTSRGEVKALIASIKAAQ